MIDYEKGDAQSIDIAAANNSLADWKLSFFGHFYYIFVILKMVQTDFDVR